MSLRKNMRTIIAIYGKSNSGKTSTIKEISRVLCERNNISPQLVAEKGEDIYQVLEIQKVKIGIISQGDVGNWVKEYLKELFDRGCTIIICATRTRGSTCDAVKEYGNECSIKWHKIEYYDSLTINAIKNKTVEIILDIIDNYTKK
jgi:Cdc6-like AAA superfamily ATPase